MLWYLYAMRGYPRQNAAMRTKPAQVWLVTRFTSGLIWNLFEYLARLLCGDINPTNIL